MRWRILTEGEERVKRTTRSSVGSLRIKLYDNIRPPRVIYQEEPPPIGLTP